MKFQALYFTAVFFVLAALGPRQAYAMGLGPGLFKIQNVPPGQSVDVRKLSGVVFTVTNSSDKEESFSLLCKKPSQGGLVDWEAGYEEIADAAWCKLEKEEFAVAAKSKAEIGLIIEVPDKPEYYNCKWMLAVVLTSGGNKGIGVGLAVAARVQIETLPGVKEDTVSAMPLGIVPSALDISVKPGEAFKRSVLLRNNTSKKVMCITERLVDIYTDPRKHDRYTSGGFKPLIATTWLTEKFETFSLKSGKKEKLKLVGRAPETAKPGEKWEELVFVCGKPDEKMNEGEKNERNTNIKTFFRVRYTVVAP
ncbi:MAG: hypothetical protein V1899_05460 [Planctomycetota bacterium]